MKTLPNQRKPINKPKLVRSLLSSFLLPTLTLFSFLVSREALIYAFIFLSLLVSFIVSQSENMNFAISHNNHFIEKDLENMEYLYSRCSICFEASNDFCLQRCRDQFCRECFSTYVKEIVKNSWGLSIKQISCPVCSEVLELSEWSKYLDQNTIDKYEKMNTPYRGIVRYCGDCEAPVDVSDQPPFVKGEDRERCYSEIYTNLSDILKITGKITVDSNASLLARFQADSVNNLSNGEVKIRDIYSSTMYDIARLIGVRCKTGGRFKEGIQSIKPELLNLISCISKKFISLETNPERWKELQFLHLSNFQKETCTNCEKTICFSCGEIPFHENQSCLKNMKNIISRQYSTASEDTEEKIANTKWKIVNSKQCPQCSILINREEGCNKVDCLYCGHAFCWNCEGKFENGDCSYYRCDLDRTRSKVKIGEEKLALSTSPTKFEVGVPNVFQIEANMLKSLRS